MGDIWKVCVVALVAACDKGANTKAACGAGVNMLVKSVGRGDSGAEHEERMAKLKQVATARCVEDKWSAKATKCMAGTGDHTIHKSCREQHLSGEQREKFDAATAELMGPSVAQVLAEFERYRDKACACQDAACADKVEEQMTRWSVNMAKEHKEPPKMSASEMERASKIGEEMAVCMMKLKSPEDAAGAAAKEAEKAADAAHQASAQVDALIAELEALDKNVQITLDSVTAAKNKAELDAAKAKLEELKKQKAELQQRVIQAKASAAKAERQKGVNISEECMKNPLAKGCS